MVGRPNGGLQFSAGMGGCIPSTGGSYRLIRHHTEYGQSGRRVQKKKPRAVRGLNGGAGHCGPRTLPDPMTAIEFRPTPSAVCTDGAKKKARSRTGRGWPPPPRPATGTRAIRLFDRSDFTRFSPTLSAYRLHSGADSPLEGLSLPWMPWIPASMFLRL